MKDEHAVTLKLEGAEGSCRYVLRDPPSEDERIDAAGAGADGEVERVLSLVDTFGAELIFEVASDGMDPDELIDAVHALVEPVLTVDGEVLVQRIGFCFIDANDCYDADRVFPTLTAAVAAIEVDPTFETADAPTVEIDVLAEMLGVLDTEYRKVLNGERWGPLDPSEDAWRSDGLRDEEGFELVASASGFAGRLDDRRVGVRLGRVGARWFVDQMLIDTCTLTWHDSEAQARGDFGSSIESIDELTDWAGEDASLP